MSLPTDVQPCRGCGACCAAYRVSFYWAEPESAGLPLDLTERRDAHHLCMKGTSQHAPRCIALVGEIGTDVTCSVYAQRPSPCRQVQPGDPQCCQARARQGLSALPITAQPPEVV